MFEIIKEAIPGLKLLRPRTFADERGSFIKTYHKDCWDELGIGFQCREEFFSISKKGVLRGMHFQVPPAAHSKLVYCVSGSVLDVVVDIRKNSETFGKVSSVELSGENSLILFMPPGFAHGFLSLSDDSCMIYKTDKEYAPDFDRGISWNSIDFNWPIETPVVSGRDLSFQDLSSFTSPF